MADYKLYFLHDQGRISHRVDLRCDDDDQAIAAVNQHAVGQAMELWQADRIVRVFPVVEGAQNTKWPGAASHAT